MDYRQLKSQIDQAKPHDTPSIFIAIRDFAIDAFQSNPEKIYRIMQQQTLLVDRLLKHLFPNINGLTLIATGGYGRGERTPYSDLDLLILHSENSDITDNNDLLVFIHQLQTLPTKVGYSVHTPDSAIDFAGNNPIFLTSLVDMRYLGGDRLLFKHFEQLIHQRDRRLPNAETFIQLKLDEQRQRSKTHPLNQQPNIKHTIGGLRDLHTIHWMLSYTLHRHDLDYFLNEGYLTTAELNAFKQGHFLLSQIRFHLHILNKRHDDVLKLQDQDQIADKMGFYHPRMNKKIEQFMRQYYAAAFSIRFFNQVAIAALLDAITETSLEPYNNIFNHKRYTLVAKDRSYPNRLEDLLTPFLTLSQQHSLRYLDAQLCRNIRELVEKTPSKHIYQHPKLCHDFVSILAQSDHLERILTLMVDLGVLEALIPEFKRTRGQMQFDLYHQFTVDRHTLKVAENLLSLRNGSLSSGINFVLPLAKQFPQFHLLIFAALYHDIGKGTGVDHSRYGARVSYKDAIRFGFEEDEAQFISWLVKHHLHCSRVIKRQDISDPDVIKAFIQAIPSQYYLDGLFLLTIADINATNQKLWTHWQAMMFEQLYRSAQRFLNENVELSPSQQRQQVIQTLVNNRHNPIPNNIHTLWGKLPNRYFLKQRYSHLQWQIDQLSQYTFEHPLVCLPYFDQDIRQSHIFIFGQSDKNPICLITQQLFEYGLNITEANLYQPMPEYFIQKYMITDMQQKPIDQITALANIAERLQKNLTNQLSDYQHKPRRVMPSQLAQRVKNKVLFLTPTNKEPSVVVKTLDRPGLLAQLCHFFESQQLDITQARIRTFDTRVEDHFVFSNKPISETRKKIISHRLLKLLDPKTTS